MNFEKHAFLLSLIEGLEASTVPTDWSHIHKSLFLLHEAVGDLVPFEFAYRNGPYSYDIDDELAQMRSYAAIADATPQNGNGLQAGLVIFRPDQNAPMLRERYRPEPTTLRCIGVVCAFVGAVGKPPIELDRQATVAWIMRRENVRGDAAIVERFQHLKPNSTPENIERAIRLVEEWFKKAEALGKGLERSPAVALAA